MNKQLTLLILLQCADEAAQDLRWGRDPARSELRRGSDAGCSSSHS